MRHEPVMNISRKIELYRIKNLTMCDSSLISTAVFLAPYHHISPSRFHKSIAIRPRLGSDFKIQSKSESVNSGTVFPPFLQGPFFARFLVIREKQKRTLMDFRRKMTKISHFVFLFGSFFYKREKYLLVFVFIFQFSLF